MQIKASVNVVRSQKTFAGAFFERRINEKAYFAKRLFYKNRKAVMAFKLSDNYSKLSYFRQRKLYYTFSFTAWGNVAYL